MDMAGIPGKHIYELEELKLLKNTAYLAISQDNLTRKVSLDDLKLAFNGDSDEVSKNTYYSTEYMSRYFDNVDDRFREVSNEISKTNTRIDNLTEYVNQQDADIRQTIEENYNHWDTVLYSTDTKNLGDIVDLKNRVTALEYKVRNIVDISYGTEIPSELETGAIYLQYF